MSRFQFKALDESGREIAGEQEAASATDAFDRLRLRQLSPISIKLKRERPNWLRLQRPVSRRIATRYLRQLATLLSAGVSLLEAFDSLAKSGGRRELAERAGAIRRDLRAGGKLSQALERHMPEFPDYVPRFAELGENTGKLAKALSDAADRLEFDDAMRREINSALTYPTFLAIVGGAIVIAIFIFVVPRFDALLGDSRANIPAFSRSVINFGVWLRANWAAAFGTAGALVLGISILSRTRGHLLAGWLDKVPLLGQLRREGDIGGWTRTVGTALANGAGLITALDLAERSVRSSSLKKGMREIRRDVRAGKRLDEAMERAISVDPVIVDLIRTGGNSGTLDEMFLFVAKMAEEEVKDRAKRLTSLAEPIAILLISLIVASIVLSIVMAMTSVYEFDI